MNQTNSKKHQGGCHCGAVRYEVELDASSGSKCNCSVCTKISNLTAIAKPEALTVKADPAHLGMYEWGAKSGQRYFCKVCGIHCYGTGTLEQLGGAYVSVNLNTLDGVDPARINTIYFDGRHNNWMAGPRNTPWPIG